jgi:hypothetical protein
MTTLLAPQAPPRPVGLVVPTRPLVAAGAAGMTAMIVSIAVHPAGIRTGEHASYAHLLDGRTGWELAHLVLGPLGLLTVPACLLLVQLAQGRGRRLVRVGTALTAIGFIGAGFGMMAHGFVGYAALQSHAAGPGAAWLAEHADSLPGVAGWEVLGTLMVPGFVLLGVGLLRTRTVSRPLALLVLLGWLPLFATSPDGGLSALVGLPMALGFILATGRAAQLVAS